jgi:hypothetical protein
MSDKQDGQRNGYVIKCRSCGLEIDRFSLADEWFCECGAHGELTYEDEDDEEGGA